MKVSNKGFFRVKITWKFSLFEDFSKTKESHQSNPSVSDKLGMVIPCSVTYFLEESPLIPQEVAIKSSFRAKKSLKI